VCRCLITSRGTRSGGLKAEHDQGRHDGERRYAQSPASLEESRGSVLTSRKRDTRESAHLSAMGSGQSRLTLPQHPDEHRPKRPILLTVDEELGEGRLSG
jgi:hypothetical protein